MRAIEMKILRELAVSLDVSRSPPSFQVTVWTFPITRCHAIQATAWVVAGARLSMKSKILHLCRLLWRFSNPGTRIAPPMEYLTEPTELKNH
jgi:hypothetical protein